MCFYTSLLTQDVVLTSIQRHLNVMDGRWTLKQRCVLTGSITSLLTQDVVLTSIQRHFNVMDVRWTLKQRCVLTGIMLFSFIHPGQFPTSFLLGTSTLNQFLLEIVVFKESSGDEVESLMHCRLVGLGE